MFSTEKDFVHQMINCGSRVYQEDSNRLWQWISATKLEYLCFGFSYFGKVRFQTGLRA